MATEELAEELRAAVRALLRRARGADEMGQPLALVLRRLADDGPATTADLARAEHVTPQTLGQLVLELEAGGHVVRHDDPDDGRRRLVAITAAGRKLLAERRAARQSWLAQQIDDRLDADEQRKLKAAVALLRRLVD